MIINIKSYFTLFIILLYTGQVSAQIVNCNAFLKGNYVEAGINWNGAFGSSTRPPVGYHADTLGGLYNAAECGGVVTADTALGFVTDPNKDGWYVGSPAYYGDLIMAGGSPQEGWSYIGDVGAGPVQLNSWNHDALSFDSLNGASCAHQEYTDTGGVITTKWQAVVGGVYITQITILDTAKLYIRVKMYIDNTALTPVNNVYYMRTINPHNDELLSHNGATINKIEYQTPDTLNRAIVSARGTMENDAYVVLGTNDYRAEAFIDKTSPLPDATTIDNIYFMDMSNYYYAQHDSVIANTSIGLVFNIGSLSSGASDSFSFVYGFRQDVVDSVLGVTSVANNIDQYSKIQLKVFPNPTTGYFKIAGTTIGDNIAVYDVTGRKVAEYVAGNAGAYSLGDIARGTYFIVVADRNGVIKGRIPIQKN